MSIDFYFYFIYLLIYLFLFYLHTNIIHICSVYSLVQKKCDLLLSKEKENDKCVVLKVFTKIKIYIGVIPFEFVFLTSCTVKLHKITLPLCLCNKKILIVNTCDCLLICLCHNNYYVSFFCKFVFVKVIFMNHPWLIE